MDAQLLAHATPRQVQILEAVQQHGGQRAAARALGVNKSVVDEAVAAVKRKAAPPEATAGKRIMVLPDVQAKPGVDFSFLSRIGQYALDKRPEVIVCIGDFADMPSLSSYDKG